MRICPVCGHVVVGRTDKVYCSVKCKNTYNNIRMRICRAEGGLEKELPNRCSLEKNNYL